MDCIRSASANVIVVTDDLRLVHHISDILADAQTHVSRVVVRMPDGNATFASRPDVIVLDQHGCVAVCALIRRFRRRWPTVDLLVVNVSGERELSALLDAGADDVVPLDSSILPARLHASARRARTVNASSRTAVGDITFDREAHRVWCAGREVAMTPREQALLECLFCYAPEPVGTQTLSDFVWGDKPVASRRALVEVYVGYVRRKLASSQAVVIRTIRGVGYRFEQLKAPSI